MSISYRYVKINRPKPLDPIKVPAIPITLVGREQIEIVALLDSGADLTAISKSLAEILGLKLDGKREPVLGIGGKGEAIKSKVKIIVKNSHEKYTLEIPVFVFVSDLDEDFPVLLGRTGFFDNFEITFKENQGKVVLKKIEPKE